MSDRKSKGYDAHRGNRGEAPNIIQLHFARWEWLTTSDDIRGEKALGVTVGGGKAFFQKRGRGG